MHRRKKEISSVSSPCIKICKLDDDICIGCGRTKLEISQWLGMSDVEKLRVLQRIGSVKNNNE